MDPAGKSDRRFPGEGVSAQAGEKLKAMGGTKCMVVTDQGVIKTGLVDPILETLKEAGLEYVIMFLFILFSAVILQTAYMIIKIKDRQNLPEKAKA